LKRIPGLNGKLCEVWRGPDVIKERLGDVIYRMQEVDGAKRK